MLQIFEKVSDALREAFDGSHSLQKRLLKMFGSTLTDEDVTETLAKSEEVNSVMLDLIDAYKEKNAKKTMRTNGGAVINFSKKKK